jgi:predicted alpha/beta superfamily hydrolase
MVKTLKSEIDKKYRTKPNTQNTGIMGSSLGALVSFYAILKYQEVFGKAGIFRQLFGSTERKLLN